MKEQDNEHVVMYMRSIPVDVKKQFKAWCATHRVTMTEKIIDLMKETYTPTPAQR